MQSLDLPILGGSYRLREAQFNDKRTVNMYDVLDPNGRKEGYLRRFECIRPKVTSLLGNEGRQLFPFNNKMYGVVGSHVYEFNGSFTPTPLGTLSTNTGYVGIDANQKSPTPEIMFVDGVEGWVWTGSAFTKITDADFPGQPLDVDYSDGRFFVPSGETNITGLSDLDDAFAWQSLNRLKISADNDTFCVGCAILNGKVYIFGTHSIQMFYNAGGASPPFKPDKTFSPNLGCASTGSIGVNGDVDANGNGSIFFLGATKGGSFPVMKIVGSSLQKISEQWVDDLINNFLNPSDCRAYVYSEGGHIFYLLNFTADNKSLIWDDTTGRWFEREMIDGSRYIGQAHAYFNGTHCLLSYKNGFLYDMNKGYLDNDGESPRYLIKTSPFINKDYNQIRGIELRLDVNKGIGTLIPPNDKPTIRLRISTDGGVTFGNTFEQSLSPIGDYSLFTTFRELFGFANARVIVMELECTSKIDFNLFGTAFYYEVMSR